MKRHGIIAITLGLSLLCFACAGSDTQSSTASNVEYTPSQSLKEVDAELDELNAQTAAFKKEYDMLQKGVLNRLNFDEPVAKNSLQLNIFINANNILVVNEKSMSRNDFLDYVGDALPRLCKPNPTLSIDKRANYDTAAWVLQELYSRGCTQVDIK